MGEVAIEFDNAYGVFSPGYEVTGTVVLALRESTKANSVLISVHGEARTHWTEQESRTRSVTRTDAQGHSHSATETYYETIHYSASVPYADGKAVVWTPPGGQSVDYLPPGNHRFPFRFLLPANCPASFEGSRGYIRYYCKGRIDRPWYKFDHTAKRVFTVISPSDLNMIPSAGLPVENMQSKSAGVLFFKNGRVNLTVRLHKGGFVPGESIMLVADVVNTSSNKIKNIRIKIVQCSHYIAYRGHQEVGFGGMSHSHAHRKEEQREVYRKEEKVEIAKNSSEKITRMIPIPAVSSTFNNCPIITVEYFLKMKVQTNGTISTTVSAELPVIIGTIPLRQAPQPLVSMPDLPGAPPAYPQLPAMDTLPSYADCVFGAGQVKDQDETAAFTPLYPIYPNIMPSAPPMEEKA